MSGKSPRPPTVLEYLLEQDFMPQAEGTWFDRHTGQGTIRVVRDPGEETHLISLTPRGVCPYKAAFSPGTPDTVIIAVVEAALGQPPEAGRRRTARRRPGGAREGGGDPR